MPTPSTPSRRFSPRSPLANVAFAALLAALLGPACASHDPSGDGRARSSDVALSIGPGSLSLDVGESVTIDATVSTTASARLYTLQYQSSNAQVATVSNAGLITGVSAGSAQVTVTATLLDTGGSASAVVTVTVGGGSSPDAGTDAPTPAPALALSPASMDFGKVTVGTVGPTSTVTLTNSGTNSLVLTACALAGDFAWGADSPTECVMGNAYAPGASCTMAISAAPKSAGALSGTLTLTDSAADSPQVVALTETGVTASSEKPFLGLSFQGLSLDIGARTYSGGGWTDIVGTDAVYGDSSPRFPAALWGGTAPDIDSLQMIWNDPSDITRQIVTDDSVPPGVSNRALEFTFVNPYANPTQDNFQLFPDITQPEGMVYFSRWIWLQPDLASRGPFWFELNETKTNGASLGGGNLNAERFGVGIDMASWTNNEPMFYLSHDIWNQTVYSVYAEPLLTTSSSNGPMVTGQSSYAPVPLGQWFRLECAWNRSMNGTGWMWMALTVPGSSDPNLQKGAQVFAQSGALDYNWNGTAETLGWNQESNDPINRIYAFGAYSNLTRSPSSTYSIKTTNIEVWPTWPSTASAHPADFH